MADKLFLDTSALYAYFDKSDAEHERVTSILETTEDNFISSDYIVDELITLLRVRHFAVEQIQDFINELWQEKFCQLLYVTPNIQQEAWKMLIKYKDHRFSFTDCTSFVLMKNKYPIQILW